jgi:subtilase family serine protease
VADTKSYTVTNAFWISNCVAGLYLFEVQAPPTTTTFRVLVPDTNGVVYAHSNLVASANNTYPPDTVAWGTAASDARYLRRGEAGASATNVYHSAAGTGVTVTSIRWPWIPLSRSPTRRRPEVSPEQWQWQPTPRPPGA